MESDSVCVVEGIESSNEAIIWRRVAIIDFIFDQMRCKARINERECVYIRENRFSPVGFKLSVMCPIIYQVNIETDYRFI